MNITNSNLDEEDETEELHFDMKECERCEKVKPKKNEDDPYCHDCMEAITKL